LFMVEHILVLGLPTIHITLLLGGFQKTIPIPMVFDVYYTMETRYRIYGGAWAAKYPSNLQTTTPDYTWLPVGFDFDRCSRYGFRCVLRYEN